MLYFGMVDAECRGRCRCLVYRLDRGELSCKSISSQPMIPFTSRYIYYIYMKPLEGVSPVCVCVRERERERETDLDSKCRAYCQEEHREIKGMVVWSGKRAVILVWLAALVVVVSMGAVSAAYKDLKAKGALDPASTHYIVLEPRRRSRQERFFCLARGRCRYKTIECPAECPQRKPRRNKVFKGCFADCSSRCETTCKHRLPNCNGYGSVCYDPRFVGGDGQMFYFHGAKGGDFAIVSDDQFQINAHFIGIRPEGRPRDFTWVQALAVMFESHSLVVAARRVDKWDDRFDALAVRWDGKEVTVPTDGEAEWRAPTGGEGKKGSGGTGTREVVVERTGETNSVRVTVAGVVEMDVKVVPITEEEDRAHGYRLPPGDAFAHLEMQFRFAGLTERVEGVLGQTYRAEYVSPVKKGVAMPMMGGEDKYRTTSLLSTSCPYCRFHPPTRVVVDESAAVDVA